MTGHDPLCVEAESDVYFCICDVLERARTDERERLKKELWPMLAAAAADERAELHARVEALESLQMRRLDDVYDWYVLRDDVLLLVDGHRR